jgi:ATP/maltotriose-dependent transcriptional regulator MalT
MEKGLSKKLTLLSIPPGFEKTMPLGGWLRESRGRATWISLDERDNDRSLARWRIFNAPAKQRLIAAILLHLGGL